MKLMRWMVQGGERDELHGESSYSSVMWVWFGGWDYEIHNYIFDRILSPTLLCDKIIYIFVM